MTGLSGVLNLRYHGTSPANLRSIATSGFTGGVLPSWAGKGAVFTSTPNVSSTYGPRQIPIVQSAKNLTVPGGGIPGQTFTEALKNIGKTKFGFETALKPDQATKGMTAFERMKVKYPNSPTFQRLLQTGTTAIKNPTNWLKVAGVPLSALTGILSSTPVGSATMPEYGSEEYKTLMAREAFFRKKQKQANVFKQMKQKQLAEEAAAKKAAEEKAAANRKAQQQKTIAARGTAQGSGGTFVDRKTGAMKGYEKGAGGGKDAPSQHFYIARGGLAQRAPRYANGGLINFYRYGGYLG